MEFLTNNYQTIILVLGALYPPVLYLLPVKYATKIDLGVKVLKTVADTLQKAIDTKGGLTPQFENPETKIYYQKSKI